jgi:hypothetical protein
MYLSILCTFLRQHYQVGRFTRDPGQSEEKLMHQTDCFTVLSLDHPRTLSVKLRD